MMSRYPSESRVQVEHFQRIAEGDEVIIGRPEVGAFVALPPEALELLDLLASGKRVREAEALYEAKHGEKPPTEELLVALEARGFVHPSSSDQPDAPAPIPSEQSTAVPVRHHFARFPERLARLLFGRVALGCHALLISLGVLALLSTPSLVGTTRGLAPSQHFSLTLLVLMALGLLTTFIHELAHLVAARAVGVGSRLGIGHRLWMVVAEADLSGLWMVERRARYLPLLAGPLVDLTSAAVLVLVLFAGARGWVTLSPWVQHLSQGAFFMYLFRLLWQCYLFVRTDFYYALANLLGCKSLMQDTEALLRHQLGRLLGRREQPSPLADLPAREARFIRLYAGVWLLGRLAAFTVLLTLQLPFLVGFVSGLHQALTAADSTRYAVTDALLVSGLTVLGLVIGLGLWLRSLLQGYLRHRSARGAHPPTLEQR
jgi:putative peptide zinc metalloprotease protein